MKHTLKLLLAFTLAGVASKSQAAPLVLAQGGKPNATIILQADAPERMQQSAWDLQLYIEKISGVKLPLNADGKDVAGITLNIGKTATATVADFPDADLNPETYAIAQRGDDVYFTGNYPAPTAFAVYSFLESQLGVRWFAPGDDWEYVPQSPRPGALEVDVKGVVSTPDFSPRVWSGHRYGPEWEQWNLRNKAVQSEKVPRRNFQNNMYRVFLQSKYAKTHPEYFPLINGKRWIPSEDSYRYWYPCIGSPAVQQVTLQYIDNYFKANPDQDSFSLGMDDVVQMCECPLCRAMDAHPDDYEKRRFSNRFYTFVNIIARQVKQKHPDKYIGTLVYNIARELPEKVPHIEDNVFGYLTQISANWFFPGEREKDIALTKAWAARMKHLSRYDYFSLNTMAPRFFPHWMDEALKLDKSLGFDGMYGEIYTFLPQTAPMIWSLAKLQWDTDQNVDVLLDEFYTKMFGPAAPSVKEYFTLMENSWMENRSGRDSQYFRNIVTQATSVSPDAVTRGLEALDRATAQAATPLQKKRVEFIKAGLQYASYAIYEHDIAQRLARLQINDSAQAANAVEEVKQFGKLIAEREQYWAAALTRQDMVGVNLRGMATPSGSGRTPSFQTNAAPLETPAVSGILRLIDWLKQHQPDRSAGLSREILAALPEGEVRTAVQAWNTIQVQQPPSLVKNGGFESTAANTAQAEADWDSKSAPAGWSLWSRYQTGSAQRMQGRNGGHSLQLVAPPTDTGRETTSLLQNMPAKPGDKFVAIAWIKASADDAPRQASMSLRSRGGGKFLGTGNRITAIADGNWQPLIIAMTAVRGATSVTVSLGVENGKATIDDVAVYKIP